MIACTTYLKLFKINYKNSRIMCWIFQKFLLTCLYFLNLRYKSIDSMLWEYWRSFLNRQPHKMVKKHIQKICRQQPNSLIMFDHFAGFTLKGLNRVSSLVWWPCLWLLAEPSSYWERNVIFKISSVLLPYELWN